MTLLRRKVTTVPDNPLLQYKGYHVHKAHCSRQLAQLLILDKNNNIIMTNATTIVLLIKKRIIVNSQIKIVSFIKFILFFHKVCSLGCLLGYIRRDLLVKVGRHREISGGTSASVVHTAKCLPSPGVCSLYVRALQLLLLESRKESTARWVLAADHAGTSMPSTCLVVVSCQLSAFHP